MERTKIQFAASSISATLRVSPARALLMSRRTGFQIGILGIWFFLSSFVYAGPHRFLFDETYASTETPVALSKEARVADVAMPAAYRRADGLLDLYPNALAAYSLRKLRSSYTGPAVRVKRMSDGSQRDFSFVGDDLDTAGIEAWLAGSDGAVVKWYSQMAGHPAMVPGNAEGPLIAQNGSVLVDDNGYPEMKTGVGNHWGLHTESGLPAPLSNGNASVFMVLETDGPSGGTGSILSFAWAGTWPNEHFEMKTNGQNQYWFSGPGSGPLWDDRTRLPISWEKNAVIAVLDASASEFKVYQNDETILSGPTEFDALVSRGYFFVGLHSKYLNTGAEIRLSEVVIYEALPTDQEVWDRYDNINGYWQVGPTGTNRDAILPQQYQYQVDLYNWLETFSVDDLVLPVLPFTWDGSGLSDDEIADIWLQLEGATASSVVRGEPDWYVLDAGNGKGIEATGEVRIWHEPRDGDYGGNPARSWSNEPAFLYQLDIPLSGGSQGNPYFQHPVLCHRAMIVTAVDLMMYHKTMAGGGFAGWGDMYGKALLGWAEAYRWCKSAIPASVQQAFEQGFEYFLDQMITVGPRAVNTNMDMFAVQGAADLYMAANDPQVRQKAVQAVKRSLFGYTDGELGVRHKVFKAGDDDGGVFDPSGFIMEGDQPDIFYGGESIYHLAGALAAVTDRETGHVEDDWAFLEEVVRRVQEWRTYQYFYDLGIASPYNGGIKPATLLTAGAGFSGRTGAGAPAGQAAEKWKFNFLADAFSDARHLMDLKSVGEMEAGVQGRMNYLNTKLSSVYVATPPAWNGWSPWTKKTPYLPPRGWYSRLRDLQDSNDPSILSPVERNTYYNKAFGGYPTGYEYWAYKGSDGTRDWGFFLEAQAKQGGYGGWYGGKIETFWTSTTGVIVLNRHGKAGCDGHFEDSTCWDNLDSKAAQHVWGRDENEKGFTTLLLRGQDLQREATFNTSASVPSVSINNVFNDPSHDPTSGLSGEQTGSEIEGSFEVINTFEAYSNGVKVTHQVISDGTDDITELWASLPIYLRYYAPDNPGDQLQMGLDDTTIEYWTGSAWESVPEDTNGDGVPELVSTNSLRLGRDYLLGAGMQYAYIAFEQQQSVRLSHQIYMDPYQTKSRVRTVHIDLHGNPGSVRAMPTDRTLHYTIQTTDPSAPTPENINHHIDFVGGWNLTSTFISPDNPSMEAIFANTDVVLVKDQAGRAYIPEFGINDIGDWNPLQAYMVYAPLAETITIEGNPIIPQETPISLAVDWNFVSYLRDEPLPIEDALQSIVSSITLVTNRAGEVYVPDFGINDIGSMNPGEGYKIYMEQSAVLTYPSNTTQAAKGGVAAANYETHTSLPGIPSSMLVLVEGTSLKEGSEIIAKTSDGKEVGRGSVRQGRATVTVQGDEALTPDIVEGASAGETLVLEVAMSTSEEQQVLGLASLRDALHDQLRSGELQYAEDAFFIAKVEDVPRQFSLAQNYPNPFNPSTTLAYDLPTNAQVVLDVYNMLGQRVAVLVDEKQEPGSYLVSFEAKDLASGVYVYRLRAGSLQSTRKMLLMK